MKKAGLILTKTVGCLICLALMAINFSPQMLKIREMPNNIYVDSESGYDFAYQLSEPFSIVDNKGVAVSGDLSERLNDPRASSSMESFTIDLFGFPIKKVNVFSRDEIYVMPGGSSVGVTMYTKGILVVGLGNVDTASGPVSPASLAGVRAGDTILEIDGIPVEGTLHMVELCGMNRTGPISLTVLRGDSRFHAEITPAVDAADGEAKLGMWVRESTAGIGTLSFYVMSTKRFGALGHAITDADTGSMLQIKSGEIIESNIIGISLGAQGTPGEIKGTFGAGSKRLGSILSNTPYGIYGRLYDAIANPLYPNGVPLAYPDEVKMGKAEVLTSVDGGGVRAYECEIIKAYSQTEPDTKGLVVKITDPQLISKTGGIVQGMSGSPIIQNGKLIAAITHVFINDPLKGYCVYAYWMNEQCVNITE